MTAPLIAHYSSGVMIFLLDAAVRSMVLACLAALGLATLRMRQVTVHLAVWTGVLYAALAMPLLVRVSPAIPFRIPKPHVDPDTPILATEEVSGAGWMEARESAEGPTRYLGLRQPSHRSRSTPDRDRLVTEGRSAGADFSPRAGNGSSLNTGAPALALGERHQGAAGKLLQLALKPAWELGSALARLPRIVTPARIFAIYVLGLAFLLGRLITGFFLGERLRRNLTPVDDPQALQWVERHARVMGLRRAPTLAESPAVSVPLTVGVFYPVTVIPSGWREWPSAKLATVIAHEISHVRRNDSRTRVAALVHQCFFWFSPLGWWLERRLADLAEQASDEAAIRAGAEPAEYAQVLLSFFEISARQGRVNWQSISMARGLRARIRIEKVLTSGEALPAAIKAPMLTLLALCALPLVWLAAATRPMLVARSDSVSSMPLNRNAARLQFLPRVPAGPKTSHLRQAAASEVPPLRPAAPFKGPSFLDEKAGQHEASPQASTPGDSTGLLTPSRRGDPPITMGIVIGGMRANWAGVTAAVFPLVEASMPHDQVCVVNSGGLTCVMDFKDKGCSVNLNIKDEAFNRLPYGDHFTSDIREMEQAIARTDSWSGGMRGAVWMAIDQVEQIPQNERKVLVLIADGIDTYSKVTQEELLAKVRNSGVRVYCLGLQGLPTCLPPLNDNSRMDDSRQAGAVRLALGQLAEASGGRAYYPEDLTELKSISREIADQVRE